MKALRAGSLSLCIFLSGPSFAAILLVAPSGTDTGDCTASPCVTAGYALTQATAGDTISLAAGTYAENILVDKSVTIAGAGQAATTLVPAVSQPTCASGGGSMCGALANASNVIVVQSSGVTIEDLTIDGDNPALTSSVNVGGANIDARNGIIENTLTGAHYDGTTVRRVTVRNIYLRGIYASSGGSGFVFEDDVVDNVQAEYASIAIFAWTASGRVQRCTVSRANDAISANWSRGIQFLDNTVTASASGVHTDNNGGSGGVADLISGNTISSGTPGSYGAWVFAPYRSVVVQNNTITNVAVGLCVSGSGAPAATPVFSGNVVAGSNETGGAGFYVTTNEFGWGSADVRVTVTGNTFTNTTEGLYLEAETVGATAYGATVTATGNTISGATGNGVFFAEPASGTGTYAVALHLNRIAGNGVGIANGIAGNSVAAERNWWGCNGGPGAVTALGTCNAVTGAGTTVTAPVLVLDVTAVPPAIVQGSPSVTTADLAHDSVAAPAPPGVPDGTPVSFSSTLAGSGMVPTSAATASGSAASTLSSTQPGATMACATVDLEKQCTAVCEIPQTPAAANDGPVCAGATLSLSTAAVSGATYSWTGPSGFASAAPNPVIAGVTDANAGTYQVTISVGGCNSPAGSTVVTVNPDTAPPVVTAPSAITVDQTVCCGVFGGTSGAALAGWLAGGTATDDCDASPARLAPRIGGNDVAEGTCLEVGTTQVTFRFQDTSSKLGTATSGVTVRMFADLTLDGVVDPSDMVVLRAYFNFGATPGVPPFAAPLGIADVDHDLDVGPSDMVVLRAYLNFAVACLAP